MTKHLPNCCTSLEGLAQMAEQKFAPRSHTHAIFLFLKVVSDLSFKKEAAHANARFSSD